MIRKVASLVFAGALVCAGASPKKTKLSSDLVDPAAQNSPQVIVQWKTDIGPSTRQKVLDLGGTVVAEFENLHSGTYLIPRASLPVLDADPAVAFVSLNRRVRRKMALAAAATNAPAVWQAGFVGNGIGVAVLDSGMNQDSNLAANNKKLVYTEDFTVTVPTNSDGKAGSKPASYGLDWYGHGQHIAGIIASNGKDSLCKDCSKSFIGIAPGVSLINLKVLDVNGEGDDNSVIAAINRAIALKSTYNIRVLNLSLGRPVFESYQQDPLCQAVEAAWQAGITVVVAAGNDGRDNSFGTQGYGTITSPGNDPYVITVGSMKTEGTPTRADDLIASYSSKGPTSIDHVVKPDIVAPGNQIMSLMAQHAILPMQNPQNIPPVSSYQNESSHLDPMPTQPAVPSDPATQPSGPKIPSGYSKTYYVLSGTSMAAAVVSGAVADLLQAAPGLTPDQVKFILMQTASKSFPYLSTVTDPATGQTYTSYYDLFTIGAGYLDLSAALSAVSKVPAQVSALSPLATYNGVTGDVQLQLDPASIFSSKGVWGSSVVLGTKAVWGSQAVWGSVANTAQRGVWGSSAVWSTKGVWGSSNTAPESITINGEN